MLTKSFEKELEQLLNKHSIDNLCNMPDFILAQFLCNIIDHLQKTNRAVTRWKGNENGPIAEGKVSEIPRSS